MHLKVFLKLKKYSLFCGKIYKKNPKNPKKSKKPKKPKKTHWDVFFLPGFFPTLHLVDLGLGPHQQLVRGDEDGGAVVGAEGGHLRHRVRNMNNL